MVISNYQFQKPEYIYHCKGTDINQGSLAGIRVICEFKSIWQQQLDHMKEP